MKTLLTISFITLFFVTTSFPWGEEGHQAVGEAASAMLTPHVREIIKDMFGSDDLASASLWLDNVRAAARHHTGPLKNDPETMAFNTKFPDNASWHFVNLPVGFSDYQLNGSFSSRNDIVHALRRAIAVLEGKSSEFTKVQALRVIAHLVGDIHQPLHTVSGYYNLSDMNAPKLVSKPGEALGKPQDRGGNQLFFTRSRELHGLWDSKLVEKAGGTRSYIVLARQLVGSPGARMTGGDYHAWPIKWVRGF